MRRIGNSKPALATAERTRSRASRTALSPSPTIPNAGRPARMSTSTQTGRASRPSSAKDRTRASIRRPHREGRAGGGPSGGAPASERAPEVVQRHEPPVGADRHADGVEPEIGAPRAIADLREPGGGHAAHLRLLDRADRLERRPRRAAPGLHLAEDERGAVVGDEVELAEAGAVTASEDLVPAAFEVGGGEGLALLAEEVTEIGGHAPDGPTATPSGRAGRALSHGSVNEAA